MPPLDFGLGLCRYAHGGGQGGGQGVFPTPIDNFNIVSSFKARMRMRQVYKPSLCVVLQGAKEITLGEETLRYGAMECLAVGMTLLSLQLLVQIGDQHIHEHREDEE